MAIGGALRAAIRAGRFDVARRESRRHARALASLNETGPVGARTSSPIPFPGVERGFDPARVAGQAFGASPRGAAVVVDPSTGRRVVLPQAFDDFIEGVPMPRSPIRAPYEGMRVWPESYGGAPVAYSPGSIPSWMGRGTPPIASQVRFPQGSVFTPQKTEPYFNKMAVDSWMSPEYYGTGY
jgi:hypothetical protein